MTWPDSSVYRGEWQQGVQEGLGIMVYPDGSQRAGLFKGNKLVEDLKTNHFMQRKDLQPGFKQQL